MASQWNQMFIQRFVISRSSFNAPLLGTIIWWGIFNKVFKNRGSTWSIMMRRSTNPTWHLWWWPDVRSLLGDSRGTGSPPSGWGPKTECLPSWPAWTLGSCGILPIPWQSCAVHKYHSELAAFKQHLFQTCIRNDPNNHSVFSQWRALLCFWKLKSKTGVSVNNVLPFIWVNFWDVGKVWWEMVLKVSATQTWYHWANLTGSLGSI